MTQEEKRKIAEGLKLLVEECIDKILKCDKKEDALDTMRDALDTLHKYREHASAEEWRKLFLKYINTVNEKFYD